MNNDQIGELHPAFRPSDSSASALAIDPFEVDPSEQSIGEVLAYLKELQDQLLPAIPVTRKVPRSISSITEAIMRGCGLLGLAREEQ